MSNDKPAASAPARDELGEAVLKYLAFMSGGNPLTRELCERAYRDGAASLHQQIVELQESVDRRAKAYNELSERHDALHQQIRALSAYVTHQPTCRRGRVVEPVPCPECQEKMIRVRNTSCYLNDDQFDAVKAGDWFCKRHEQIVYLWDSQTMKHGCSCGLDALLTPAPPAPED